MSKELASKLKAARARLALSQKAAAAAWQIPLDTLVSWENDRRTPKGIALRLLLERLDAILSDPPPSAPPPPKPARKRTK